VVASLRCWRRGGDPPPPPCVRRRRRGFGSIMTHWGIPVRHGRSSPSPAGYEREEGYSQPNATLDLCVNVLVRPMRISPRQSGAAGPCTSVVPFGGARQGPDRRSRTAVQQRRPGRVPRFLGAYHHRLPTSCPASRLLAVTSPHPPRTAERRRPSGRLEQMRMRRADAKG